MGLGEGPFGGVDERGRGTGRWKTEGGEGEGEWRHGSDDGRYLLLEPPRRMRVEGERAGGCGRPG